MTGRQLAGTGVAAQVALSELGSLPPPPGPAAVWLRGLHGMAVPRIMSDGHLDCKFNTPVIARFWLALDPPAMYLHPPPVTNCCAKSPGGRACSRGSTIQRPEAPTRHPPCTQGTLEKITSPGASCVLFVQGPRAAEQEPTTESVAPQRALCCGELCSVEKLYTRELCTMEIFTPQRALNHGEPGTMASFVSWLVLHHGELCTTACVAPR